MPAACRCPGASRRAETSAYGRSRRSARRKIQAAAGWKAGASRISPSRRDWPVANVVFPSGAQPAGRVRRSCHPPFDSWSGGLRYANSPTRNALVTRAKANSASILRRRRTFLHLLREAGAPSWIGRHRSPSQAARLTGIPWQIGDLSASHEAFAFASTRGSKSKPFASSHRWKSAR